MSELILTAEFREALATLARGENLFLTGKAGTGKSTLIRLFMADTKRNVLVTAPTGIAALNVAGYTIHRLFSFYPGITPAEVASEQYYPGRFARTIASLDALIIDEASMVRADLFDCLALALERFGPEPNTPFGGVQVVLVGDLYQLPPVVTTVEEDYFASRYDTPFFYSADRYDPNDFPVVQLTTVFRQFGDSALVDILNEVREGVLLDDARAKLNQRTDREFSPPVDEMWVTLAATNRIVTARNRAMLRQLPGPVETFTARTSGQLDGFEPTADPRFEVALGAQVMMLTNDPDDGWVNGSLGRVAAIRQGDWGPLITVEFADGSSAQVGQNIWEVTRPVIDGGVLRHKVIGTFTQFPMKLAWAITIHKSQGQTLERVVVDLTGGTFADGQLYVALSRCTSLAGLVLRREVEPRHLRVDARVRRFLSSKATVHRSRGDAYLAMCAVGSNGLRWRPRPVEIAVVTDDGEELTSLINPTSDLHDARTQFQIAVADVLLAPRLAEAWAVLAPFLTGRTVVGADVDTLLGCVDFELKRNGHVYPMPVGVELPRGLLTPAERAGLGAATALQRACTVRDAARRLGIGDPCADAFVDPPPGTGYLLARGTGPECFTVGGASSEVSESAVLAHHLRSAVSRVQLDSAAVERLRAVEWFHNISVLDDAAYQQPPASPAGLLLPGIRVCFTGTVIADGCALERADLEGMAAAAGLVPVPRVTKTRCDVLVTAEAGSQSGKARKAVQYDKPIITAEAFLDWTRLAQRMVSLGQVGTS